MGLGRQAAGGDKVAEEMNRGPCRRRDDQLSVQSQYLVSSGSRSGHSVNASLNLLQPVLCRYNERSNLTRRPQCKSHYFRFSDPANSR
jgi:hypothetical protein